MINRSTLRHACFRAKNGAATPENWALLEKEVAPKLNETQRWENFTEVWDLLYHKNEVIIIKPEVDIDFIRTACITKQIQEKAGVDLDSLGWSTRHENVITIVEVHMLDGIMTWQNYNQAWGVEVDTQLKAIHTKMFVKNSQKAVTPEMILASRVSSDDAPFIGEPPTVLEAQPVSDEERVLLEKFLAKHYTHK